MGRKAAYHVRLADGREVGFGLVRRDGSGYYSVQFRDPDQKKSIFRATGERSRPRALAVAERVVKEHFRPVRESAPAMGWDDVLAALEAHLTADGARPSTVGDYLDTIRQARSAAGTPAAVTPDLAQRWCNAYLTGRYARSKADGARVYARSPRTLHARVRKLRAVWGKYVVKRLRAAERNPWEAVELPKLDTLPVRTLSAEAVAAFFGWLADRWRGWELPTLFFETKAVTGCRLADLCAVRSADLKDGKLVFAAGTAKARKQRVAVLPADLFAQLARIGGRTYLWESYAAELPKYLKLRGVPAHRVSAAFDPVRLCWWAKDEVDDFNKAHPDAPRLKSHDFRKRAITEAHRAGMDVDTAAAAVGMSASTARAYYLAIDQEVAAGQLTARLADTLRPGRPPA